MALYTLAPQPWLVFLDDAGLIIPAGQLAVYAAGTSTPALTYTAAGGIAHPFPITLDGAGRVPGGLYLQPGLNYKFVLHAPQLEEPLDGAIIKTQDNIEAVPSSNNTLLSITVPGDHPVIDVAGVNLIEYVGAGDTTIRSLVGGVQGQSILIRNLTNFTVWLSDHDPVAPFGGWLVNAIHGQMPLVGPLGSARYTYLSSQAWVMESYAQGRPITQPFDAANYSGQGAMLWGVDAFHVDNETFYLNGRMLLYNFHLFLTDIGGTPDLNLLRLLPFGWNAFGTDHIASIITTYDGGVTYPAGFATMFDLAHVGFQRTPVGAPWVVGTDIATVAGQIEIVLA